MGCHSLELLLRGPVQIHAHNFAPGPTLGQIPQIQHCFSPLQGQLVTKDYPGYALAVIGLLVAASTMCVPLGALVTFIRKRLKRERVSTVA